MTRRLPRWSPLATLLPAMLLGACVIPNTVEALGDGSPPPEFGRPFWVRGLAGLGGWVGGVTGGVLSVVLLPITYPLSLLADDGLGEQGSNEFLLFPAVTMAGFGHAAFGLPADLLDWSFRRVWVGTNPDVVMDYKFTPLPGPEVPKLMPKPEGEGAAPR